MPTVLIVEDERLDRKFLASLLRSAAYEVLEATDGEEAFRIAASCPLDLVITDMVMPSLDAHELVRRLRKISGVEQTPIVFYTASYHERPASLVAQQSGAAEILTKPSDPKTILATIASVLRSQRPNGSAPLDRAAASDPDHARVVSSKLVSSVESVHASEQRMAAIVDVANEIAAERDPYALLERVCAEARRVTLAQHAVVGLVDDDLATVKTVIATGTSHPRSEFYVGSIANTPISVVVRERRPLRIRRAQDTGMGNLPGPVPIHSYLGVPIASANRVYGWLGLRNKLGAEEFGPADEQVAAALATHAAIAYENAILYEDLLKRTYALEEEVAERARAEQALRANEERTRFALRAARTCVWEWDVTTDRIVWLDTESVPFGFCVQPATGQEFMEQMHPDDRPSVATGYDAALHGGTDMVVDFRTKWPDGTVHWLAMTGRLIKSETGEPLRVPGTSTDITERRLLEERYRQSQKMEAIGQLAGGVAHDFNNLLTAILGYANLLADALSPADLNRKEVGEIVKAAESAASLTSQLLTFSRKQAQQMQLVDVNSTVANTSRLLRRVIGETIQLTTILSPRLSPVRADPTQLQQIIMNLAVNARDAMPAGGQLTIETRDVHLEQADAVSPQIVEPGSYVMLAVTDTGAGMDEATKQRIFEPFFTTKAAGHGTGLGLATVYGIVRQTNGHIWVYSEPGQGTAFKIYLPAASGRVDVPAASAAVRKPTGSETILVLEDERAVRGLTRVILERSGYRVLDAATFDEAQVLLEAEPDRIDLLVTDVVMPGLSGRAAYERLAETRPGLKVLYMSGYMSDMIAGEGRLDPGTAFLEKPFTAAGLTAAVRNALDQ